MIRRLLLLLALALGATLLVPATAQAAPDDDVVKVVVVRTPEQNGGKPDSLEQIAQRTLGDPSRAAEILDLNRGRAQSDGGAVTDSGQLNAGWILLLPDDAEGPDVQFGKVGTSPAAAEKSRFTWKVVAALVGSLLLALLCLLVLFRRRITGRMRARYRTYRENARWHSQIQERMRVRADLAAQFASDRATPAIAGQVAAELAAMDVEAYALRVAADTVTAWVTAEHAPRLPWQAESDGVWTRPTRSAAHRPSLADPVTPCLVRIGGDDEGMLLVDLTWLDGVLAIGGSAGVAIDVVANLLADVTRFRSDLQVLSIPGFGGESPGLPSSAIRLRSANELHLLGPAPGTDDGMVRVAVRRRSLTALAVIAETPSAEETAHLLAACGPGSGQVAIVLGDLPGAHWRWKAEADGKVTLPEIGVTVTGPSR